MKLLSFRFCGFCSNFFALKQIIKKWKHDIIALGLQEMFLSLENADKYDVGLLICVRNKRVSKPANCCSNSSASITASCQSLGVPQEYLSTKGRNKII